MSIGSVGLAGFGAGALKGFETMRRYDQEDERMAMAKENHALGIEGKRQSIDQRNELFPEQLQGAQLGNQGKQQTLDYNEQANPLRIEGMQLGNDVRQQSYDFNEQANPLRIEGMQLGNDVRQQSYDFNEQANPVRIEGMELGNDIRQQGYDFNEQVNPLKINAAQRSDVEGERAEQAKALEHEFKNTIFRIQGGDMSALNDYNAMIAEVTGTAVKYTIEPGTKPGTVIAKSSDGKENVEMTYKDAIRRLYENGSPDRLLASIDKEYTPTKGMEIKDTLSYFRQKSSSFWGKMNPDGAFIIPESARTQNDLAEQRMGELGRYMSPQAAARYANLSVLPEMSDDQARELAAEQLRGQSSGAAPSPIEVIKLADQLKKQGREALHAYQQITGGGIDSKLKGLKLGEAGTTGGAPQAAPATSIQSSTRQAPVKHPSTKTPEEKDLKHLGDNYNDPKVKAYFKKTFGYLPATDKAIRILKSDPSVKNRHFFKSTYGYLPEGL